MVTTTVLFTDIVASTEQSADGTPTSGQLTDSHDAMVGPAWSAIVVREIKTIGDGFLAT